MHIAHANLKNEKTAGLRALQGVERVLNELEADPHRCREALEMIEDFLRDHHGLTLVRKAGEPSRLVASVSDMLEIAENPHGFLSSLRAIHADPELGEGNGYAHLANIVVEGAIRKITAAFRETGIIAKEVK